MTSPLSLVKGGDADGKRAWGESPSLPGVFHHHLVGADLHIPKSVLAARWPDRAANDS